MIKTLSLISLMAGIALIPAAPASAMTAQQARECRAMSVSIQTRQKEAQTRSDARSVLLEQVETAGDAWEEAEALRLFSDEHAADADAKRADYEGLKADLLREETSLQSDVAIINSDLAAYRSRCTKK